MTKDSFIAHTDSNVVDHVHSELGFKVLAKFVRCISAKRRAIAFVWVNTLPSYLEISTRYKDI